MCIFARRMEVYLPLLYSLTYIIYIRVVLKINEFV